MSENYANVFALEVQSTVQTMERVVLSINVEKVFNNMPINTNTMYYFNFNLFIKDFCIVMPCTLMSPFISYSSDVGKKDFIFYGYYWNYVIEKWKLDMALGHINLLEEISILSYHGKTTEILNEVVRIRTSIIKLVDNYYQSFTNSCRLFLVKYVKESFTDIKDLSVPVTVFK